MSKIDGLVVVLGKRLCQNELTAEGRSRVEALTSTQRWPESTALAFCGGITNHQSVSEANRLNDYFQQLQLRSDAPLSFATQLLEEHSTSTVENIRHLAEVLLASELVSKGQNLKVTFVSNDYHLQRIFEIQQLMDEQGLLRVLVEKCREHGVELSISNELSDHILASYPHESLQGRLFLALDELTTYRVYLEGVRDGNFARPLSLVREVPLAKARKTLARIKTLLQGVNSFPLLEIQLPAIERVIEATSQESDLSVIAEYAAMFDSQMNFLNRYLDPERDNQVSWWK